MPLSSFHPLVRDWFLRRVGAPTEPQRRGWPLIADNQHTLIAAPTGSGKTLAAFLACIDRLLRAGLDGALTDQVEILYVSPLRALSSDVRRNLEEPLRELREAATAAGLLLPELRIGLRTGDTSAAERQALTRRPPHILITTPESLYLYLTAAKASAGLQRVRTVIVDEIHALVRDKRGAHLALSLERLDALCAAAGQPAPTRVGLSATQRPIETVARFLVGAGRVAADGTPACQIVDCGHLRRVDLKVLTPREELGAVCSGPQWGDVHDQVAELVKEHKTTLIFVGTRRLAERTAHSLAERLGDDAVTVHHGSLSRRLRQQAEERLKQGQLKAVVATASLELGIDIGSVDLVCQIGSPRAIATLLQRVGRANHRPSEPAPAGAATTDDPAARETALLPPKGRLFALTRDELIECSALVRAARAGEFDRVVMPECPLDVLAQQLCAVCAAAGEEGVDEDALYALCHRAWPFRDLTRAAFDAVVGTLADGVATRRGRSGTHLHRDEVNHRLRARRGTRLFAMLNGGTIPEPNDYDVVAEPSEVKLGKLDEEWVVESGVGEVFLLGTSAWRIRRVQGDKVYVEDAGGATPTIPFWAGEAPGRTFELSLAVSQLRADLEQRLIAASTDAAAVPSRLRELVAWLAAECAISEGAAGQIVAYLAAGRSALGRLPTANALIAERFFDEGGGMQLVLHMPLGARINRAFGLALRKRFCRSFNFELQAAATDDGVLLSLGETHSFPLESVWNFLSPASVAHVLEQAVLGAPVFQPHFRWTAQRALAVPRRRTGKKVPPPIVRILTEDLLAAVFPHAAACPENLPGGDIEIPDHPLVQETLRECLRDVMDIDGLHGLLSRVAAGEVTVHAVDTPEPSVLAHQLLSAAPYAFLDDTPLEERRVRAMNVRRGLPADIALAAGAVGLDPAAIAAVWGEAWPTIRGPDELHDALLTLHLLPEARADAVHQGYLQVLISQRRACVLRCGTLQALCASERAPLLRHLYAQAQPALPCTFTPEPPLIPGRQIAADVSEEVLATEVLRGWLAATGPWSAPALATLLGLPLPLVDVALLRLEGEGQVLRGRFTPAAAALGAGEGATTEAPVLEWCDRRLLARIHRLTTQRLRREIEPVSPAMLWQFLARWQHASPGTLLSGVPGLMQVLRQLQGFEAPAGTWEADLLPARLRGYDPAWLDELCLSGEVAWGRLRPQSGDLRRGPTRAAPLSLWLRPDQGWLLRDCTDAEPRLSPLAATLLRLLSQRGALFLRELCEGAKEERTKVEEALGELVAAGLAAADSFAGLRGLIGDLRSPRAGAGRWSRLVADAPCPDESAPRMSLPWESTPAVESWARLYLRRYGVLTRELLTRELGPPWHEITPVLRRMEAKGELRGGRFVTGLSGEQYALPEALESLRALRKSLSAAAREPRQSEGRAPASELAVSAADPLNLVGVLFPGARVPSSAGARLRFRDGLPVSPTEAALCA